jgi:hypothetical protein
MSEQLSCSDKSKAMTWWSVVVYLCLSQDLAECTHQDMGGTQWKLTDCF